MYGRVAAYVPYESPTGSAPVTASRGLVLSVGRISLVKRRMKMKYDDDTLDAAADAVKKYADETHMPHSRFTTCLRCDITAALYVAAQRVRELNLARILEEAGR